MSNIHFVLQGKGGVGKTFKSSMLMQYLKSIHNDVFGIDTDSVNHTFSQYKSYNAAEYDIYNPATSYLDERVIEQMAEYIYESGHDHVVIDNGASSFVPLLQYLVNNNIIQLLQDAGHTVYIHTILTGGQGLDDTAGGISTLLGSFPDAKLIVWLNYKFGDIEKDGKLFYEWPLYKKNKDRFIAIIPIDFPSSQLYQEDLDFMLTNKFTFDEAMAASKLFSRNRLKQMKEQVFQAIQETGLMLHPTH
jgi:hypothetical protein